MRTAELALVAVLGIAVVGVVLTAIIPAVTLGYNYVVAGFGIGVSLVSSSSGTEVVLNDLVTNDGFTWVQSNGGIQLYETSASVITSGISLLSATSNVVYLTPFTTNIRLTDMPDGDGTQYKRFEAAITFTFNLTDNQAGFYANIGLPDIFPHTLFRSYTPLGAVSCIWGGGTTPYKSTIYAQLYTGGTNPPFIFFYFNTDYAPNSPGLCSIKYYDILPYEI